MDELSRPEFKQRRIRLVGPVQLETALAALRNAPLDSVRPLEMVLREEPKARKPDQNSAYWAGPLRDISEQAWFLGRQYSADVLHDYFKRMYLPEHDDPELAVLVKDPDAWLKWDFDPGGNRVLVGSTTQLTRKGFARYVQQIEAEGAQMGVQFHDVAHAPGR